MKDVSWRHVERAEWRGGRGAFGVVKLLRRLAAALAMAGIAAAGIRLKGTGGVPPQHGGWRPLELPPESS